MCLVTETDRQSDVRDRFAAQEAAPGHHHPPSDEVAVRRQPDLMPTAVSTADMVTTGHDEANRAAVRGADLDLVGVAVLGPRTAVDTIMKGAALHP